MRRIGIYALLSVLQFAGGLRAQRKPATAFSQESISIAIPNKKDVVTQFAARELARYLQKITEQPAIIGNNPLGHHIDVGLIPGYIPPATRNDLQKARGDLSDDGFLIRTVGSDIVILGKGSRGNLYGCYAFLEHLGIHWFFPGKDYEVVPRKKIDWKDQLNISESPAFPERILFYWPNNYTNVTDWIDYAAKARLNCIAFHYTWPARDWYIDLRKQLLPGLEKRGFEIEAGGHFLPNFLPRALINQHPDWFRLNQKGKRVNDFNLNPFSVQALECLTSGAEKYLLQMPEVRLFHLWPDDMRGGGWSDEPGKEDCTPSDQSLLVANSLITRLR